MKTEKKNITWKLKEAPTAEGLAKLVEQGVLKAEEAREMVAGSAESDKEKIKALEEMVAFLQGLVENLSKQRSTTYLPYERTVYVDRTTRPYWDRIWAGTEKVLVANGMEYSSSMKDNYGGSVQSLSLSVNSDKKLG